MMPGGMMINSEDPWKNILRPEQESRISSRRVDPSLRWDIYWAVDVDSRCLLVFQHTSGSSSRNRLPNIRGLEVETRVLHETDKILLIVRLKENEQREIFQRLCNDLVSVTRLAHSEEEAVERFLGRTWRWHRLLRGGGDARLSDAEQKGLIGELHFMRNHLFPTIGVRAALRSWTGPLLAPKDFEVGRVCIEVKSRRGAAKPFVSISSEHQLDRRGIDSLFLQVFEVTSSSGEEKRSNTVTEIARNVLEEVRSYDENAVEIFEERLAAVGFDWNDDYSDKRWLQGSEYLFELVEGFPSIAPGMYPAGVSGVRYSVSLPDCEQFRSSYDTLYLQLKGGTSVY